MSNIVRWFSRTSLNVLNNNTKRQIIFNATARTLYSETSLGIDEYKNIREIIQQKYKSGSDIFKSKIMNSLKNEKSIIFSEDLKTLVHLIGKTPEDVAMLRDLINKYNTQNNEYHSGSYKFGPIIMRALHYLNEPDIAFELFMNPNSDELFRQVTTFMVLADLLYENQRYSEIRQVYDKISTKFEQELLYPKLMVNIVAMSCYKENTQDSLEYGLLICKNITMKGYQPTRRIISALGALALKHNAPHLTLELITQAKQKSYITIKCLKIMALADLNRLDDVVIELRDFVKFGSQSKGLFYSDIIPKIQDAIQRVDLSEDSELSQLLKVLQNTGFIQNLTLEEHMEIPIELLSHRFKRSRQSDNWSSNPLDSYGRQQKSYQYNKPYNQG